MTTRNLIIFLTCFFIKFVYNQDDNTDYSELKSLTDKDKFVKSIYEQVKREFYQKYGNREFTVLERINFLKDNLKSVFDLTNNRNLPDDLKMIFRTTFNSLRPDLAKLNHNDIVLKSKFNLTDGEVASYRNSYSEAKTLFAALEKRFKLEGDC